MQRRSFLSLLVAAPFVPALAKLQAVIEPAAPLAPLLRDQQIMRFVMSMSTPEPVEVGRVGIIRMFPQVLFRPERLLINHQSRAFSLLNVSAAGDPQFDDEVEAELFSEHAFGQLLTFGAIRPGEEIVLAVLNRGAAPVPFTAAFIGSAVG